MQAFAHRAVYVSGFGKYGFRIVEKQHPEVFGRDGVQHIFASRDYFIHGNQFWIWRRKSEAVFRIRICGFDSFDDAGCGFGKFLWISVY